MLTHVAILLVLAIGAQATPGCVARKYDDGIVCVCNSTYCDDIEPIGTIAPGYAVVYRSDEEGARMDRSTVQQTTNASGLVAILDPSTVYQEIIGFGGAFTDSTGVNLLTLPPAAREMFMKQYFGPTGTEYTIGRVPMASTDFSLYQYGYADVDQDFNLTSFALANDDFMYKIPFIKQAMELQKSTGGLKLFATPWSAPAWMKANGAMKGGAKLRGEEGGPYYVTWADYFVKFFEAYADQGINFWGVTIQNEPSTGADPDYDWQTMFFDAKMEREFVRDLLGPTLKTSNASKDVLIMGMDDNRFLLPSFADVMFEDKAAADMVAGIAVHWYEDDIFPASALTTTHEKHPTKFILATEACNGWLRVQGKGVKLGDFSRGERYAHSIIEDLNNWVAGWTDWNLAVDTNGGYTWALNVVDAPIIVETNNGEFLKQPMYYAMAHFSKFLKPGSHRVKLDLPDLPKHVEALGAVMVDGKRFVAIMNKNDTEDVQISLSEKGINGVYTTVSVPAHSMVTVIWNKY